MTTRPKHSDLQNFIRSSKYTQYCFANKTPTGPILNYIRTCIVKCIFFILMFSPWIMPHTVVDTKCLLDPLFLFGVIFAAKSSYFFGVVLERKLSLIKLLAKKWLTLKKNWTCTLWIWSHKKRHLFLLSHNFVRLLHNFNG